jgi:hypothetical protein
VLDGTATAGSEGTVQLATSSEAIRPELAEVATSEGVDWIDVPASRK